MLPFAEVLPETDATLEPALATLGLPPEPTLKENPLTLTNVDAIASSWAMASLVDAPVHILMPVTDVAPKIYQWSRPKNGKPLQKEP